MKTLVIFTFLFSILFISCTKNRITNPIVDDTLTQGLMAYYSFDSTYTTKNDSLNAEAFYCDFTANKNGTQYKAVQLDGLSSCLVIPSEFDLETKSISFWLYPEIIDDSYRIAYLSDNGTLMYGHTIIYVQKVNSIPFLIFHRGSRKDTIEIAEKQWYHVAMVTDKRNSASYVNGSLVRQDSITQYIHSVDGIEATVIGSARTLDKFYFKGKIDELYIFNRAITTSEVTQLFVK